MAQLRVMISGGGTGGHIFPAVAIADEIKRRHPEAVFQFVGAKDKMEMEKVPQAGYPIEGLWISGIQRKLSLDNLSFPFKLLSSLFKSRKLLRGFKPDVVIGTGGFASGPLLWAAAQKGIPTLIQEQNSYPGITNKLLAKKVNSICVAYEGMEKWFPKNKIHLTGNPLRQGLEQALPADAQAKSALGLNPDWPSLLVLGGSLGARRINHLISALIPELEKLELNLVWQCGKLYFEALQAQHPELPKHIRLQAFISNMPEAYRASDIVISRAGANTLSELAVVAKAAILIPSPNVAEDHQTKNAQALSSKKAAILFTENRSAEELLSEIKQLLESEELRQQLTQDIQALALPNASATIVDQIEKLTGNA